MHDNQDQVKAFHSKMLLADVIQEREAQEELKERRKEQDKNIEHQWHEAELEQLEEYDEKTRKKLEQTYQSKMQNAQVIKRQLHDFKIKAIKQYKDERLEGELIKRQTQSDLEKEREKELQKRVQGAKTRQELTQANEDLKAYLAKQKKLEQEEEKKIAIYAKRKDEVDQLRKDKEE